MKRLIMFIAWAMALIGTMSFMNCADPLEDTDYGRLVPVGPVIDTTYSTDTVVVLDTTSRVDTVVVDPSGSGGSTILCARISPAQKEIVWMFRNPEGPYLLEFVALCESDTPVQTVIMNIDGEEYSWNPAKNPEYVIEQDLGQNAVIIITPKKPPAFGHSIDICLTISAVEP